MDPAFFQEGLEAMYGPRGGRGVALRIGRASFKYILRQFGEEMGFTSLDFRMLPPILKIRNGLCQLANKLSNLTGSSIKIIEEENNWFFQIENCPFCEGRHSAEPMCHFFIGFLQEFLAWTTGGKYYNIFERECRAINGRFCTIQIDKKALE
jgi:predicted hydrocarbon binding protein